MALGNIFINTKLKPYIATKIFDCCRYFYSFSGATGGQPPKMGSSIQARLNGLAQWSGTPAARGCRQHP